MFDSLKAMGALGQLMKNKDAIKAAMERVKQRLGDMRLVGSAAGGAVRVTISGDMRVIESHLEPAVAGAIGGGAGDVSSREMVEKLIVEATNDAIEKAKAAAQNEFMREANALGLGDMMGSGGMEGLRGLLG